MDHGPWELIEFEGEMRVHSRNESGQMQSCGMGQRGPWEGRNQLERVTEVRAIIIGGYGGRWSLKGRLVLWSARVRAVYGVGYSVPHSD